MNIEPKLNTGHPMPEPAMRRRKTKSASAFDSLARQDITAPSQNRSDWFDSVGFAWVGNNHGG
jgi:hypothetical protein